MFFFFFFFETAAILPSSSDDIYEILVDSFFGSDVFRLFNDQVVLKVVLGSVDDKRLILDQLEIDFFPLEMIEACVDRVAEELSPAHPALHIRHQHPLEQIAQRL